MKRNHIVRVLRHFGVTNIQELREVREFKKIAGTAKAFFIDGSYTRPWIWFIDPNGRGLDGWSLKNGKWDLWVSRAIHTIYE